MAHWNLDPAHSSAEFSAKHMMITTVRGRLAVVGGVIDFDPANPAAASVEATLDAASINSGVGDRDGHLKSPDFLDVATYPTITFKSTRVEPTGGDKARIHGDLTVRGTTRPVVLEAEFLGAGKNPFDQTERAGFIASTAINREDWGLTWNVALEAGGILVGKEIRISLDVQAIKVTKAVTA
jgi:polyisoprenoid-binding protein YceI